MSLTWASISVKVASYMPPAVVAPCVWIGLIPLTGGIITLAQNVFYAELQQSSLYIKRKFNLF